SAAVVAIADGALLGEGGLEVGVVRGDITEGLFEVGAAGVADALVVADGAGAAGGAGGGHQNGTSVSSSSGSAWSTWSGRTSWLSCGCRWVGGWYAWMAERAAAAPC